MTVSGQMERRNNTISAQLLHHLLIPFLRSSVDTNRKRDFVCLQDSPESNGPRRHGNSRDEDDPRNCGQDPPPSIDAVDLSSVGHIGSANDSPR